MVILPLPGGMNTSEGGAGEFGPPSDEADRRTMARPPLS